MADDQVNQTFIGRTPAQHSIDQDDQVNQAPAQEPVKEIPVQQAVEEEDHSDTESPVPDKKEETHVGPHLQLRPRHEVAWQYTQQFGLQTFLFLQLVWNFLSYVASTTQTVSKGVVRSIQKQLYVFFEHSNYPYRVQDVRLTGPGVAPVEWYYDADKSLFISSALYTTTTDYETNHLEWLSGQIKYNNLVLYDVSEFLQQIRWAGRVKPSVPRVLAAWSLHSGIVLNAGEGLSLQTINEDGTESTLVLRGQGA